MKGTSFVLSVMLYLAEKQHEIFFWQLLMENFFLKHVVSTLSPPPIASPASCSMELTCIEENAMLYNAGYVIRRVLKRYSKQKSQEEVECMREVKEMVRKYPPAQLQQS